MRDHQERRVDAGHEGWEFENRVNRLRNLVEEIVDLLAEVPETMLTISSRPLSLAPAGPSAAPDLPGGMALVVLGPWADVASVPDGAPHPAVVFAELAEFVREAQGLPSVEREPMRDSVPFLLEHLRWIVAHPEGADHVERRLEGVRHHLQVLVGDAEPPRLPTAEELVEQMRGMIAAAPERYRMTPAEADHVWPGIHARLRKAKERGTAGLPEPGPDGRFTCAQLLPYTVDRRTRAPVQG